VFLNVSFTGEEAALLMTVTEHQKKVKKPKATLLMPMTEHQMKVKKPKATLLMGMTSCSGPRINPTVAQETIGGNLTCMQH
jgi:hypothetical protein